MWLVKLLNDFWKGIGVLLIIIFVGGFISFLKPTEEDKYLGKQMKMYPIGFHCTNEKDESVVVHLDMKSQISFSEDKNIYKYTMKNALYRNDEKKPFGCEMLISHKGIEQTVFVYIADEKLTDFNTVRFESTDDKDVIYEVVHKTVKKKQYEKIHIKR